MHDGDARGAGAPARAEAPRAEHAPRERPRLEWERGRHARERSQAERERSRTAREWSQDVLERSRAVRVPPEGSLVPAWLAGRLVAAQEEERRRIARELHDGVGQRVAAACIALGRLAHDLPDPVAAALREVAGVLAGVSAEVRALSHAMHPPVLELAGLAAALREHCAELRRLARLEVEVSTGVSPSLPRAAALCLYRVAQEALGNVAAHSGVRRASLRVFQRGGAVELEVRDAGRGFDRAWVRPGLGLVGMHERVRLLGGALEVETRPGGGTCVRARLPVDPAMDGGPAAAPPRF